MCTMCVLYTVLGLRRHVVHVNFSLMFGKGKRFELETEWIELIFGKKYLCSTRGAGTCSGYMCSMRGAGACSRYVCSMRGA